MTKMNVEKFAQAYIQTLPHAKKPEEFETDEDYRSYLGSRFQNYLDEYVHIIDTLNDMSSKTNHENDLSDE